MNEDNHTQVANNLIVSCSGLVLTQDEASLLSELQPWGIILFARNIESPLQVRRLLDDIKLALDDDELVVLIDQEGGRVSRLPYPQWRIPPSPQVFAKLYERDKHKALRACFLNNLIIGCELKSVGINVNCAPMLDIPQKDAADIIHERSYGNAHSADNIQQVIALGEQVISGLEQAHVSAVIKHIPGHGRGRSDSHFTLPRVEASLNELENSDFKPFLALNHAPMAMSAHIVYEAIDSLNPGSVSKTVVKELIRKRIGFEGLLMTDDINMQALKGSISERARQALDAGNDVVLHCSGEFEEMASLLDVASPLSGQSKYRAAYAKQQATLPMPVFDIEAAQAELSALLR
ncbi:beta-N-acetylhexosaminidase [Ningiella sp. W23]|uniref:beta-N-acetylhexosaminidase n=1 Tax=Ningiella sp. W23 TaxID=3023715 RepID=UPI00375835E4